MSLQRSERQGSSLPCYFYAFYSRCLWLALFLERVLNYFHANVCLYSAQLNKELTLPEKKCNNNHYGNVSCLDLVGTQCVPNVSCPYFYALNEQHCEVHKTYNMLFCKRHEDKNNQAFTLAQCRSVEFLPLEIQKRVLRCNQGSEREISMKYFLMSHITQFSRQYSAAGIYLVGLALKNSK